MLQRNGIEIFGFLALANLTPPQGVPTMISSNLVEPGRKRAALVVLMQLASQFHEDFHGGVFRILPRRQSSSAKPENGRSVIVVKLAPSLGITCPSLSDRLRGFRCSGSTHPAWSQRFHNVVRTRQAKTYLRRPSSGTPKAFPGNALLFASAR